MLAALGLLALFGGVSPEYFFVLCLIGFLAIVELGGPSTVRPAWRSRMNIAIVLGVLAFSLLVVGKVLAILGA